jgi:AraC family transcriptional regulator
MNSQSSQLLPWATSNEPCRVQLAELGLSACDLQNEVVHHLVSALRASSACQAVNPVFVDRVESALRVYMATCLKTQTSAPRRSARGSLPLWKERRVKELLQSELSSKLSLKRLASECGLSIRQFTRAFRLSTGSSPRRYLLKLRIDKARQLLMNPDLPLREVAMSCGFADQSHFTRAFSAAEQMSPGLWRRRHVYPSMTSGVAFKTRSGAASG